MESVEIQIARHWSVPLKGCEMPCEQVVYFRNGQAHCFAGALKERLLRAVAADRGHNAGIIAGTCYADPAQVMRWYRGEDMPGGESRQLLEDYILGRIEQPETRGGRVLRWRVFCRIPGPMGEHWQRAGTSDYQTTIDAQEALPDLMRSNRGAHAWRISLTMPRQKENN